MENCPPKWTLTETQKTLIERYQNSEKHINHTAPKQQLSSSKDLNYYSHASPNGRRRKTGRMQPINQQKLTVFTQRSDSQTHDNKENESENVQNFVSIWKRTNTTALVNRTFFKKQHSTSSQLKTQLNLHHHKNCPSRWSIPNHLTINKEKETYFQLFSCQRTIF